MYWTFGYMYNVENLDGVSSWNTSGVTNMQGTFNTCKSIESLDLSKWNTSNVTNFYNMFNYCTSLESLNLDNWNFTKANSLYMFSEVPNLKEL